MKILKCSDNVTRRDARDETRRRKKLLQDQDDGVWGIFLYTFDPFIIYRSGMENIMATFTSQHKFSIYVSTSQLSPFL